jgi:tetratricopeptide (TPR) repeat protein
VGGVEAAEQALLLADEAGSRLDVEGCVTHLSAAIREFTAAGEPMRAAMTCVRLGDVLATAMGNLTASRAWFARARRLVEAEPPCLEQGWVAVAAMGCDVDDPAALLAAAELALDRARRFGDVNLETKALADAGLAHVQAGRVDRGMALLDEAMALACGPADDSDTAAKSVCSFFTACYYSADFGRAASWTGLLRQRGLISSAPGAPVFLSSHCDSVQARLLLELGRWTEAEMVLTRAKSDFEAAMPIASWHPDIALADLRTRQGRLAEAESLLVGKDQSVEALLPAARLHLARGDFDLAAAMARRGLRAIGNDRLRATELLTVLVDAEIARGDIAAATEACGALADRTSGLDVVPLNARAAAARARVQVATGAVADGIATLEAAIDDVDQSTLPWLRATLYLHLARLREQAGDGQAATIDATAAMTLLAKLDVVIDGEDLALLERLRPQLGISRSAGRVAVLSRDVKWWTASCDGSSVRLQDSKGLRYLAELVARPGVERHVLDLVDSVEGVSADGGLDRRTLGDAGSVLDARARDAYRRRVEKLRAEADDALEAGLLESAEAKQAELDQLVVQLAQAFGLGGRDRRAASVAERSRLNVTRALRSALGKVGDALPQAGPVLDRRVRTGLYCAYEPADNDEVRWIVQS